MIKRKRPHLVRVIYKSGATIDVACVNFKTKRNAFNELSGVEWEGASPDALFIGVDDIAAVWKVK